ncbi:hypothetical protein PGIGA_G00057560 [Pangasianodon gigas]|uniref:Uncharacterized protein n=1 Tax=Pangasianodon gigas TaxID=30993 RepID=A0ACC5X428_PANGG|nr:hypothetical protein [Pangasianodon gigas]
MSQVLLLISSLCFAKCHVLKKHCKYKPVFCNILLCNRNSHKMIVHSTCVENGKYALCCFV